MGLLKVASLVVGCNLLVSVQLGQVGRFGRLVRKSGELRQVMSCSGNLLSKSACARH